MPRTTNDRARSQEAKAARWRAILDAAATVFDAVEPDECTMDAVAAEVGMVKGALYRYVRTRESLLLAVTGEEYRAFFADVEHRLAAAPRSRTAVAEALVEAVLHRPRFLRLLAVTPTVLERNVPLDDAVAFKQGLLRDGAPATVVLAAALRCEPADAWRLLIHLQAVAVGLHQHAHPAPVVREAFTRPDLAPFRIDLRDELGHAVRALVAAVPRRAAGQPPASPEPSKEQRT